MADVLTLVQGECQLEFDSGSSSLEEGDSDPIDLRQVPFWRESSRIAW
jgi:hypothetical protein